MNRPAARPEPARAIPTGRVTGERDITELDLAAAVFLGVRPRLAAIAYRILGTASDAEDVVQDVWLRWHGTDRAVVINPPAFLAATTVRLAINQSVSAWRRHETCSSSSLPEPADGCVEPEAWAERGEAVELAVRLLLEKLTPMELATYVLREAFGYPYRQIAEVLRCGEANARQVARRARIRIADERRTPVSPAAHRRLVRAFLAAAQAGALTDLEEVLAEGAVA
jgi:RNA polymerase sigma factor (sigma-70 family)